MTRTGAGTVPHASLRIGPVTLRNRIVFPAHLTNFSVDGTVTDRHIAYYEARARGGASMIVTEEHTVHPSDRPYEKLIRGWDPDVLAGYRRLTDAVHRYGTRILAQLNHNGAQGTSMYTGQPLWAPSPEPDPLFREVPRAMTESDITELVAGYADVARRCAEGGFDGVEIQCSQASVLRAFLAPATNRRTDRYGGDLAGRARLLLEVVSAVRHAVGRDRVVGVRLTGHDGTDGGVGIDDAVQVARMLEASGDVDYLNTSVGVATETLHLVEARCPPRTVTRCSSPTRSGPQCRCPSSGSGVSPDPNRSVPRSPTEYAIWSAPCARRSPTRSSRTRSSPDATTRYGRASAATRNASAGSDSTVPSHARSILTPDTNPTALPRLPHRSGSSWSAADPPVSGRRQRLPDRDIRSLCSNGTGCTGGQIREAAAAPPPVPNCSAA